MSTAKLPKPSAAAEPLVEGQRMDQPTFHDRYLAMPPGARAELIGGVVSMPRPVGFDHARPFGPLFVWLDHYTESTSGVEWLDNVTVILDERNEIQPDLLLRVLPERGGQSRNRDGYVVGAPELIVEVARSSRFRDLGPKFDEYQHAGVLEYVVWALDPEEILWYVLREGKLAEISPDADGLYRSRAFPGLWLDPVALRAYNRPALRAAVDRGLHTPEHAAFLARLAR